jgi:hypothetical protein
VHQPHTIRQLVIAWRVRSNLKFPPVNREVREPSVCLLEVHAYGKIKEETLVLSMTPRLIFITTFGVA